MTIYTVWTRDPYEPEMLAIFTNEPAATEYAERHNARVFRDMAFHHRGRGGCLRGLR